MLASCQFQQIVHQFFRDHSRVVSKWPLPFLLGPLLLTGCLGSSLILHRDRLEEKVEEDRLSLFLPEKVAAMEDMQVLKKVFPSQDITRDSYDVFKSAFTFVILEDASPAGNVLQNRILQAAAEIHQKVRQLEVNIGWLSAAWKDLCYRKDGGCLEHPVVVLLNGTDPLSTIRFFLKYPRFHIGNQTINNAPIFGSVTLNAEDMIISARALRIPYILQEYETQTQDLKILSYLWQKEFVRLLRSIKYEGINIYFTSSISWAEEIDRNGKIILPYIPLLFASLFVFSVGSCFTTDWVVSKPWLGVCGILNAILAVIASIGTLIFLDYPFLQMVSIMPFLILSISVDNMFLMLNQFRNTHPLQSVEERMAVAVGESAVSIMVTALTDGLSFSVGSISQFPAVRIFCTYCALAILFVFIFQMSFFTACMALTGRREAANRHCITCSYTLPRNACGGKPWWYKVFCSGGYYVASEGRKVPSKIQTQFLTKFLSTTYADVVSAVPAKVLIVLLYLAYIGGSIYGVMRLPLGLDLKLLVPEDSYTALELAASERHFSAYGGYAYVYLEGQDKIAYHETPVARNLVQLFRALSNTDFTEGGEFWLLHFYRFLNHTTFSGPEDFALKVKTFLDHPNSKKFRNDVRLSEGPAPKILATKMLLQTRFVTFANHTPIAKKLRGIFEKSPFKNTGFVYEPSFLLVDQEASTLENMLQNVGIAVGLMLAIAFLFIPKLISAIWIGVSILSINIGVIGGLAMWGVRLDIVSMITIVMSIGFSVDFIAHITYHFLISRGKDRLHKALRYVGTPILQSAASTVLGVCSLIPADSYMVRTFVKTVVLVVGLGVLHGLLFLPVILSIFVPADQYLEALGEIYGPLMGQYLTNNIPKFGTSLRIGNKRMRPYLSSPSSAEEGATTSDESMTDASLPLPPPPLVQHERLQTKTALPARRSIASQGRSVSELNLYEFLKFKSGRLDLVASQESEADIYSEVCQDTCKACSPHGCQMHSSASQRPHRSNSGSSVGLAPRSHHSRRSLPSYHLLPASSSSSSNHSDRSIHNFRKPRLHSAQRYPETTFSSSRQSNRMYLKRNQRSSDAGSDLPPPPRETLKQRPVGSAPKARTETVEIALRGLRGTKSAENLHCSVESLDSDTFGAFRGERVMMRGSFHDFATFKGSSATASTQILGQPLSSTTEEETDEDPILY